MTRRHESDADAIARTLETPFVREALAQFGIESSTVRSLIRNAAHGAAYIAAALARILGEYVPGGQYHADWLRRFARLITSTVQVGGEAVAQSVGFDFTLTNPRVQSVIRQRAAALVTNVTATTRDSIRAAVEIGHAQGLGSRQIADLIHETTFGEIAKARALTIARTETIGALNAGEYLSAQQSGIMRSKEWRTNQDDRVRESHEKQHGLRIDFEQAFPNGLLFPGQPGAAAEEVINCRCTLLFSDEEP